MANRPVDIDMGEYVRLVKAGLTGDQIAEELHIGRSSLARWKKRNGIKSGREPKEYTLLKDLGLLDKEIAKRWNISPSALYQWKKAKGLL